MTETSTTITNVLSGREMIKIKPMNYFAVAGIKREPNPKSKEEIKEYIIEAVCSYTGVTRDRLPSKRRVRELVYCRQLITYFLWNKATLTLKEIALVFGRQDHTTIIHSRNTITDRLCVEDAVKHDVKYLTLQIEEKLQMVQYAN